MIIIQTTKTHDIAKNCIEYIFSPPLSVVEENICAKLLLNCSHTT